MTQVPPMLPKFPDLSTLPVEQQIIAWIAISLIAILAVLVTRFAFKSGQTSPRDEDKGKIVALSADTGALNRATAAIEGLTMSVVELNMKMHRGTEMNKEFQDKVKELTTQVDELSKQIEILGRLKR